MGEFRRSYLETTENGCVVSVDMEASHAASHLQAEPKLRSLAREALRRISITEEDTALQVDMGRIIGEMDLVEAHPSEPRIYGQRPNRESYLPFVKRDERPLTRFVVVILTRLAHERLHAECPEPILLDPNLLEHPQYDLVSTYIGKKTPGSPDGDPEYITEESLPFWTNHALVLGAEPIEDIYEGVPPAYRRDETEFSK